MLKKAFALFSAFVLLAAMLAGCSQVQANPDSVSSQPAPSSVSIVSSIAPESVASETEASSLVLDDVEAPPATADTYLETASDDEYIYYLDTLERIWRMTKDGENPTRLTNNRCRDFYVADGWIYFIEGEILGGYGAAYTGMLMRMKTDGTEAQPLIDEWDGCTSIYGVQDGWVYHPSKDVVGTRDIGTLYNPDRAGEDHESELGGGGVQPLARTRVDGSTTEMLYDIEDVFHISSEWIYGFYQAHGMWRCRLDGSDPQAVRAFTDEDTNYGMENVMANYRISGDWIYYRIDTDPSTNSENLTNPLYRVALDGSQETQISYGPTLNLYLVDEDTIYFLNGFTDLSYSLCQVSASGGQPQQITDQLLSAWWAMDGAIYFRTADESEIWRFASSDTEPAKIFDGQAGAIEYLDDWIFFVNLDEGEIWRMRADGTDAQPI